MPKYKIVREFDPNEEYELRIGARRCSYPGGESMREGDSNG
jgi:hypothetical protein